MLTLVAQPQNSIIIARSKSFESENQCTQQDEWYGTKYSLEKYSPELIKLMTNPSSKVPDGKVGLPPRNTLLPKKLEVLGEDPENT